LKRWKWPKCNSKASGVMRKRTTRILLCRMALVSLFWLSCLLHAFAGSDPGVDTPSADQGKPDGGADAAARAFGIKAPWSNDGRPYASCPDEGINPAKTMRKFTFDPLLGLPFQRDSGSSQGEIKDILARATLASNTAVGKKAMIDQLVTVIDGQPGDPSIPDGLAFRVKEAMLAYPRQFLCLLSRKQCRVYIAPLVVRADPNLEFMRPASYAEGSTFLNCRAVFTTKGILIGSHFYRDGKLLPNLDPFHGMQHEMAHAIDHYLGRPSLSKEFVTLYDQEREAMSLVDRSALAYYVNNTRSGSIETFAQLLAHKYCHFTEHHTLALVRCFPGCVKFIDELFPEAEAR